MVWLHIVVLGNVFSMQYIFLIKVEPKYNVFSIQSQDSFFGEIRMEDEIVPFPIIPNVPLVKFLLPASS